MVSQQPPARMMGLTPRPLARLVGNLYICDDLRGIAKATSPEDNLDVHGSYFPSWSDESQRQPCEYSIKNLVLFLYVLCLMDTLNVDNIERGTSLQWHCLFEILRRLKMWSIEQIDPFHAGPPHTEHTRFDALELCIKNSICCVPWRIIMNHHRSAVLTYRSIN